MRTTCTRPGRPPMFRTGRAAVTLAFVLGFAAPVLAKPPPFQDPPTLTSEGGVLSVTFEVKPSEIRIKDKRVTSNVYDGLYIPPLLRLKQGDVLEVEQINATADLHVNFHTHGVITSPQPTADNVVMVDVAPGERYHNSIPISDANPSGMYWYHTHVHGFTNEGLAGGLSGAMIIGDPLARFPELAGITQRVMLLKDMKLAKGEPVQSPDPAGPTIRTINGVYKPEITIDPGELQLWLISNQSANIFYDLRLPHVRFSVLGVDGNPQNQLTETDELVLPPGRRFEVLVRGPRRPGNYVLKARPFKTGPDGDAYPGQLMAHLKVSKNPVANPIALPTGGFASSEDLRGSAVDVRRTVVFNDTDDPNVFVIDAKSYDPDRIDTTVQLGDLEEWRIQNASQELHVFHIHQGDFQVLSINGEPQPFTGYLDTVNLPYASKDGVPGEVVMRIRFDPPIIVGEYVYHCHIVQHEDQGMMANIVVQDAIAALMTRDEPRDLIAEATTPAAGSYWCL